MHEKYAKREPFRRSSIIIGIVGAPRKPAWTVINAPPPKPSCLQLESILAFRRVHHWPTGE